MLDRIRKHNCDIEIVTCPIQEIESQGNIDHIWHTATAYNDRMFINMTQEAWDSVVSPKVDGFLRLKTLYPDTSMTVFSSYSAVFGNPGQSSYVWANNSMENLSRMHKNTAVVQWGAIDNVGFISKSSRNKKILENLIIKPVRIDEVLDFCEQVHTLREGVYSFVAFNSKTRSSTHKEISEESIIDMLVHILGGTKDDYDTDTPLTQMGIDSLSSMEIVNNINEMSGGKSTFTVQDLNDQCTVASIIKKVK